MTCGSGCHASARGCLYLLEELFLRETPQIILNPGTGTGIPALACLKLGALKSFLLNYNNLRIEKARLNRKLNYLADRLHFWQGDVRQFLYIQCDLLMANMPWEIINQITDKKYSPPNTFTLIPDFGEM